MTKNSTKELGTYLKNARISAGITQKGVSEFLGYTTPQHISNIERNLILPSASTLIILCKLYKIDLSDPKKQWQELKWQQNAA